jgi:hypothetical protein
VVLTERSTGCQTVSQNGQLSSGVCGVAAPSQQTAIRIQQTANSVGTLLRTQLGGVRKLPTPPVASIQPVKLAPVRVIASSIRATPQTPNSGYSAPRYSAPGYSASGYSAPRYSAPGYSASGIPLHFQQYLQLRLTLQPQVQQRLQVWLTTISQPDQ